MDTCARCGITLRSDVNANLSSSLCTMCECEAGMPEACDGEREVVNHVCSECNAAVSDLFYDPKSGLCDTCIQYSDD